MKTRWLLVSIAIVGLGACGHPMEVRSTACGGEGVDTGSLDLPQTLPAGVVIRGASVGSAPANPAASAAAADTVALMTVVDRDAPQLLQTGPSLADRAVVRPVHFSVDRVLVGSMGLCATVNVPGGLAAGLMDYDATGYPAVLRPNDRVLAYFQGGRPFGMDLVGADGRVNGIDVTTWQPNIDSTKNVCVANGSSQCISSEPAAPSVSVANHR